MEVEGLKKGRFWTFGVVDRGGISLLRMSTADEQAADLWVQVCPAHAALPFPGVKPEEHANRRQSAAWLMCSCDVCGAPGARADRAGAGQHAACKAATSSMDFQHEHLRGCAGADGGRVRDARAQRALPHALAAAQRRRAMGAAPLSVAVTRARVPDPAYLVPADLAMRMSRAACFPWPQDRMNTYHPT